MKPIPGDRFRRPTAAIGGYDPSGHLQGEAKAAECREQVEKVLALAEYST